MLDAVIRFALRHRPLVVMACLAILVYGTFVTTTLPIDVFPDLDRPRVVILTECAGLAPEDVETLVTQPIERSLLGANGVQAVRSQSATGLSVIYVEFDWTTDVRVARQTVQERLMTLAGQLPQGIRPQMAPMSSIMGQIMHVGLQRRSGPNGGELAPIGNTGLYAERLPRGDSFQLWVWKPTKHQRMDEWEAIAIDSVTWGPAELSRGADATPLAQTVRLRVAGDTHEVRFPSEKQKQLALGTLAHWVIRPRLLQTRGIAEVIVLGGERRQYQVLADPRLLQEHTVSLHEVEQALRDNNLNENGGFDVKDDTERPIRIIGRLGPDPATVIRELKQIVVKRDPKRNVLLTDVARIEEGPQPKRGDAGVDGQPAVVVTIVKQPHVDTRDLTDRVKASLRDVEDSLPADVVTNVELFQLKNFIDRGVYFVGEALVVGAILVLLILTLFLLNLRTTFISLTAIPISLAVTAIVFKLIGAITGTDVSINVMTLGGIAVAMGALVDDAIVDVENIFRRLRENSALPKPRPALRVVYDASREIRSAVAFGTAVVILVFLPLFALSGVEGRLFAPLGIAFIVSILASLVVSMTVTPVLSYYLLGRSRTVHRTKDSPLLRLLKWLATPLIRFSMSWTHLLLVLTWLSVGLCILILTRLGADFLPAFDEGSVQINVGLPAGSSLDESNKTAVTVDEKLNALRKSPDNPNGPILHFVRRTGRAELDEHAQPVSNSEYILSMNPDSGRSREEMLHELLDLLKKELPGVDIEAEQPLAHLISHMLSGVTAQIAIKVYGDDLDRLRLVAERIKRIVEGVPGLTPPVIEAQQNTPEVHIRVKPDALALHGLSRAYVVGFLRNALQGGAVTQVIEGKRRFDLIVKLVDAHRTDFSKLKKLRVDLPDKKSQVELGTLVDFDEYAFGPNFVNHDNVRRRMVIRCNASGRDLASAVQEIESRVKNEVVLPEGYFVEYGGQFESQRRATRLIAVLALLSVVGMFAVLLLLFPSVRITLQILNAIPTAFIGGVLALVLTRQTLTVASLVGFIALGGIAVRNGILLVSHYLHLMREEGETFTPGMILRGSLERLSPVLMTALTAGIALVPIVIGGQKPGLEILYPVATVILGGLITSTFCEFLIHPGLFWRFSGKDAEKLAKESKDADVLT